MEQARKAEHAAAIAIILNNFTINGSGKSLEKINWMHNIT